MAKTKRVPFSKEQWERFEVARGQRLDVKEIALVLGLKPSTVRYWMTHDGTGEIREPITLLVDTAGRRLRRHLRGGGFDSMGREIGPGFLLREDVRELEIVRWISPTRNLKPFDPQLCAVFVERGWIKSASDERDLWKGAMAWRDL